MLKKFLKIMIMFLCIISVSRSSVLAMSYYEYPEFQTGIVDASVLNVRSGPRD